MHNAEIKLSEEHSEFLFRDVKTIKNPDKFEKVAQKVGSKVTDRKITEAQKRNTKNKNGTKNNKNASI